MTHDRWMAFSTKTDIAHWHDTMSDDYSEFEDELQQAQSQPDVNESQADDEAEDLDCALSAEIDALKTEARQLLRRRLELMRLRNKRR
jgi:hypothetical protein